MRRIPLLLSLAFLACNTDTIEAPIPPYSVRAIDLSNGYLALFSDRGSLQIVKDGEVVLRTAPGTSLFATLHDAEDPDGWHDPSALTDVVWEPVDAKSVRADSPAPGQLHLVLPEQSADTVLVSLALARDGGFSTGLGERFDHVAANSSVVPLFLALDGASASGTNEEHVPVPFVVSSRGYGIFVASREAGAWDGGVTEDGVNRAAFEGRSLDVTLFFDPDPLAVVAAYTRKTGLPRRPPDWAVAPMHWRNEWPDSATLLADADAYRKLKIPSSGIWIDNPWQTSYNTAKLDPLRFGDEKALMSAIAAKGFRALAWSTPYLERPKGAPADEAQQLYVEAAAKGYFVGELDGQVFPAIGCCYKGLGMIDFTSGPASSFWIGVLGNATSSGFAGFKLDYGEDLIPDVVGARLGSLRSDGESERTGRTYPLGYHRVYHEALDRARGDGFLIGRASSWGGQSFVDTIWPGDLDNGFQPKGPGFVGGLPAAVIAAQTLAMSGFPSFGSDTGGYRGGSPEREALLRWAEHTAFSMCLQLGGGGDHHNPWLYDDEAGKIYAKLAREHNRLIPYLGRLLSQAAYDGTPTIRALPLAYPNDQVAPSYADTEYMLGPDVLVAPVIEGGKSSRLVHFPAGKWAHWFDGTLVDGPDDREVPTPLGSPAVFYRAGSTIPMLPIDIDTVVEATEPGIVTRASRAKDVEARAFVGGKSATAFEEGSTLSVDDAAGSVRVRFEPQGIVEDLVVELDLRASTIAGSGALVVTSNGVMVTAATGDARACPGPCYTIDPRGATLAMHGASTFELSKQ